jgi:hypothetical protein
MSGDTDRDRYVRYVQRRKELGPVLDAFVAKKSATT